MHLAHVLGSGHLTYCVGWMQPMPAITWVGALEGKAACIAAAWLHCLEGESLQGCMVTLPCRKVSARHMDCCCIVALPHGMPYGLMALWPYAVDNRLN